MLNTEKAENLIQDVAGCGPFQVLVVLFAFILTKMAAMFSFIFMAFGNYNPGWRCLDNVTMHSNHSVNMSHLSPNPLNPNEAPDYQQLSCSYFDACMNVEFHPKTSTIVTTWGLICGRSWISSIIISLQMVGAFVGSWLSGHLGDLFGRKKIIYGSLGLMCIFNIVSLFAVSWEMFVVLRFFIGMFAAAIITLDIVLVSEFVPLKWRGVIGPIPAWSFAGVLFGISSLLSKDWKILIIVTTILGIVAFIPIVWVPESLRWLYVKKKNTEFRKVVKKMLKINSVPQALAFGIEEDGKNQVERNYSTIDLFRDGYRLYTCLVGAMWMAVSFIYYAISFGVKSMHGDFYLNLITIFALVVIFSMLSIIAPNVLGRKRAIISFFSLVAVALLMATCFEIWATTSVKMTGTTALTMVAKIGISGAFNIILGYTAEIYPTVVRSSSLGYGTLMARLGGIMAPYIIPKDRDTVYIWYLVMGVLALICCFLVSRLPETKGKRLKETFD